MAMKPIAVRGVLSHPIRVVRKLFTKARQRFLTVLYGATETASLTIEEAPASAGIVVETEARQIAKFAS